MGFVHLHLHTQYSALDGLTKISQLAEHLKKIKQTQCAITDHGNLFGILDFYNTMRSNDIKPIIGSEMYLNPEDARFPKINNFHLTLLAKNYKGLKNLYKLSSLSYIRDNKKHFYYKPRITFEDLKLYSKDIIALSGCLAGAIAKMIVLNRIEIAREYIKEKFIPIFGENFYLEVMRHGIKEEEKVIEGMKELSKEFGIPMVATNDSHYLKREDGPYHNILLAMQMTKTFKEDFETLPPHASFEEILKKVNNFEKRLGPSFEFYVKSEEEMRELFSDIPEAIDTTEKIANQIDLEIPERKTWAMPNYDLPDQYKEMDVSEGYTKYLREICEENFKKRYGNWPPEEKKKVRERFEYEFKIIAEKKFAQYFLIVRDIITWSKEHGIPIGPGRGSVVGSVVAYLSDITTIEPTSYGLLFERFLNPDRTNIPDVDIDVCQQRRGKVISYIKEKYNKSNDILGSHVCQIATFTVNKTKGIIRDVGRVLGIPLDEVNDLTKSIDKTKAKTLEDAISIDQNIETFFNKDNIHKLWKEASLKMVNLIKNSSIHAAGVVISDKPLVEYTPLFFSKEGEVVSQFTMSDIEKTHLVKWDILGLKTLTFLYETEKLIKEKDNNFSLEEVPLDDKKTYEIISSGDLQGVFQMESSSGMVSLIKRLKPNKIDDIIGGLALFRPGPLNAGLMDRYIENKKLWEEGKIDQVKKQLPFDFGNILDDAYGTMIYQEHIMLIAQKISNFTPAEADYLRKAVAKKKSSLLNEMKQKFIDNAVKNGYKRSDVISLWQQIEGFAEYAFNKSHATAYAHISYWTAYLKANYPVEFFTALINNEGDFDKKKIYYENAFKRGIKILSPDINKSYYDFTPEGNNIRYGLNHIKSTNSKFIYDLIEERREKGPYKDIWDFVERVPYKNLNKGVLEALIKVGCFDSIHKNRASLIESLDNIIEYGKKIKEERNNNMSNLFTAANIQVELYKDLKKIKKVEDFDKNERLRYEKEFLGYYFSSHPLKKYAHYYDIFPLENSIKIKNLKKGNTIGVITNVDKRFTKKDHFPYLILTVEDLQGSFQLNIYTQNYKLFSDKIKQDLEEYFKENKFKIFLFNVSKLDEKLVCNDFSPIENIWHIFNNYVKIIVDYEDIKKLSSNVLILKQIFEKSKGNTPIKLIINNMSVYDELELVLDNQFNVKVGEQFYEEIKNNFDFIECIFI